MDFPQKSSPSGKRDMVSFTVVMYAIASNDEMNTKIDLRQFYNRVECNEAIVLPQKSDPF